MITTLYNNGVATRSQALHTRRVAELEAEYLAKGDVSDKYENMYSGTLRAGDRISETVSSGRLLAMLAL
jgi:hypothetical protein